MTDYDLPKIQVLLSDGFSEDELRDLILFEPALRPLTRQLRDSDRQAAIVAHLLTWAEAEPGRLEALLAAAQAENPHRFAAGQPYRRDGQPAAPVTPPAPAPANPQLEQELARLKQALTAQKGLRGLLPEEQIEASLAGIRASAGRVVAQLVGSGAIAQGKDARAAQAEGGSVAVAGDVGGDVTLDHSRSTIDQRNQQVTHQTNVTNPPPPDPAKKALAAAQQRYLERLARHCQTLPLAALGGEEGTEGELTLDQVYIDLDTRSRVPLTEADKEARKKDTCFLLERGEDRALSIREVFEQTPRLGGS